MNSKERILNAMLGKETDRVPFSPFLTYWWDNQPDSVTAQGELHFLESIGADPMFRGHWPMTANNYETMVVFKKTIHNCEIRTEVNGNQRTTTYQTPKGKLVLGYKYSDLGKSWFLTDHPVETAEDFRILRYIMEHTELTPDYDRYHREAAALGDRGLLVPVIAPEMKSSFQSLLEVWCGTVNLVMSLDSDEDAVLDTLHVMTDLSMEAARIAADSPAEVFLSWEDTSTTNISPRYFREYILPEINGWCDILHDSGKYYMHHACGRIKYLLSDIAGSKIDALESVTPLPLGDVKLSEVHDMLPQRIAIIGGLGAGQFRDATDSQVSDMARELLSVFGDRRYVLANSDSCPPDITVEKFLRLAAATRQER